MKLFEFASFLARGEVPVEVIDIVRMGQITALSKPDGGVRGITVGDILRRFVSRTMSKRLSKAVEISTALLQDALSIPVVASAFAHVVQAFTNIDVEATVVSIDGIGAFDWISRNSMLQALWRSRAGTRPSFSSDSSTDAHRHICGKTRWDSSTRLPKVRVGEQGYPLMPLFCCSVWDNGALEAVNTRLLDNERFFADLDDIFVICAPGRVLDVHRVVEE